MKASQRKRCTPVAAWTVKVGHVIIDSWKSERGNTQREAMRVDKITDGPHGLLIFTGPRVYLTDPDRFLESGAKGRVVLPGSSRLTRILPPGHPDVAR